MTRLLLSLSLAALLPLHGQTPGAYPFKPIPPPGIEVPAADRAELEAGVKKLQDEISKLPSVTPEKGLADVQIYHKAVDWALRYNEFFSPKEIATAKELLKQGFDRASALAEALKAKKPAPWNTATGLLVRGYQSDIDKSVQPYGLVIPADYKPGDGKKYPLHFWCHGRGEKLTELSFIAEHQKSPGEFVPPGAIVCHLYGRFCNANKFAGEIDLFEALHDIKQTYAIDEQRLAIRGFSMGGAACWQFATHHPQMWAAAAPGAGFAETAEFFKVFGPGKEAPPAWEQKLWRWYDSTTMSANLANTTTVAYSGEIDGQKQAADIMVKYAAQEGITFPHIIGAQTGHKYHPDSKPEINKLVDAAVAKGREAFPRKQRMVTYSLIYPGSYSGLLIGRMEKQWERAEVNVELADDGKLAIATKNVTLFVLGELTKARPAITSIQIDGQSVPLPVKSPNRLGVSKVDGKWMSTKDALEKGPKLAEPRKGIQLCGPIDHAFMSEFIFVRPTGKPLNDEIGQWAKAEMERAISAWRQVFRGDVKVLDDVELLNQDEQTKRQMTLTHLVLWGDISSNKYLAKIADKLPLKWDAKTLEFRGQKVDAAHHAPIFVYPEPNGSRYVVLNSGFTFREAAALNNSDQTPKLPDWAIVDLRTPPGPKWPGKIVDAGFFDEEWK